MRDTTTLAMYLTKILTWHLLMESESNPAPIFIHHINDLKDELTAFLETGKVGKFGEIRGLWIREKKK